jgi:CheY-like chemotaxis protein
MGGMATLKELRRLAPGIPVVLTSGYASARLEEELVLGDRPDAVLPKPYPAERLLATLQRVMRV